MYESTLLSTLKQNRINQKHYRYWLLSSGGTFIDGLSIFFLGVALPLIDALFPVSTLMAGLMGAALVISAGLGAAVGGGMADHYGRKTVMLIDMLIMGVGALISAFANSAEVILIGQLIIGFGIGIDFPVSSSYISEIIPEKQKNRLLVGVITFQSIGMVIGAAISVAVLVKFSELGWRYLFVIEAFAALLFMLLRFSIPESPTWLEHKQKPELALQNLKTLYPNTNLTLTAISDDIKTAQKQAKTQPQNNADKGKLKTIFGKQYLRKTLLCSVPWFLMDIATYGIGIFTPIILVVLMTQAPGESVLTKDIISAKGSGVIDIFLLLGFLIGLYMVPKFGKLRMQMIGFIGMAVGMLVLAYAVYNKAPGGYPSVTLVFAGFIIFNLLMNMGPNSTTFSLATDLFPTHVRASASGFAAAMGKVGATLGTFFLPGINEKFGTPLLLVLMAVISLLGFIVTLLLREKNAHN